MKKQLSLLIILLIVSSGLFAQTSDDLVKSGIEKVNGKDYEGALADCNRALSISPQNAWAYNIRGMAKHYLKRYTEAIADYEQAIIISPKYKTA